MFEKNKKKVKIKKQYFFTKLKKYCFNIDNLKKNKTYKII